MVEFCQFYKQTFGRQSKSFENMFQINQIDQFWPN